MRAYRNVPIHRIDVQLVSAPCHLVAVAVIFRPIITRLGQVRQVLLQAPGGLDFKPPQFNRFFLSLLRSSFLAGLLLMLLFFYGLFPCIYRCRVSAYFPPRYFFTMPSCIFCGSSLFANSSNALENVGSEGTSHSLSTLPRVCVCYLFYAKLK